MADQLAIRPLQPGDLPACSQILLDNPLWQRYHLTRLGADQMLTAALASGATILTAQLADLVAGFVWYVERGAWDRSGYIRLIGVSPHFQGQRIGEALMSAAEARVAEHSPDMFLLVTDFNTGAQRFYQRLGYFQIGSIPDYVVPGISELIFYKRFSGRGSSSSLAS